MRYEWDENKRRGNVDKHGVDFSAVYGFDWESALVVVDKRRAYGEKRYGQCQGD
ncbi:BrnT family toxin [Geomesophilobacter sediminis]|uniref:BrnT family toxin n=1 Tax=Geomesophilobacter sediminis TaxID=2798584 RepID=A0A8J7S838_9BACT|nr:BrnT family toxin [Geomesophilobacter sediminis]